MKIDTTGYTHTCYKPWHKDRSYTEVWVSNDGKSWQMLGMENQSPSKDAEMNKLEVIKGCRSLGIEKGETLFVTNDPKTTGGGVWAIQFTRFNQQLRRDVSRTLYARLWKNHDEFNMNNGDPTKKIRVRKVK